MPAILLNQQVDVQALPDHKFGVWFQGAEEYLDVEPTTDQTVLLSNGVKVLGFVVNNQSGPHPYAHVILYFDDSKASEPWAPSICKLGNTFFNNGRVFENKDAKLPSKVSVALLGNQNPIAAVVTDFILS